MRLKQKSSLSCFLQLYLTFTFSTSINYGPQSRQVRRCTYSRLTLMLYRCGSNSHMPITEISSMGNKGFTPSLDIADPPTPEKRTGTGQSFFKDDMRREPIVSPETSPATIKTRSSPS
uniref:Putative lipid-A-disaccharide synthase n=1 Tax=Rhizophora mucronata TaxID=61149 RepID=A0A2P2MRG0_RHIMU